MEGASQAPPQRRERSSLKCVGFNYCLNEALARSHVPMTTKLDLYKASRVKSWPESIPSGSIINPELALVRQIQERQPRVTRGNYWALGIPARNLWHRSLQEFSKLSSNWTAAGVKVKYLPWVRTIVRIGNQEKREIFFTLDNKREVKTMTIHKMKSLQQMLNKLGQ